jgi:hypothetical protein
MHAMAYFMGMLLVEDCLATAEVSPFSTMPGYPGALPPCNLSGPRATYGFESGQPHLLRDTQRKKVGIRE